MGLCTNARRHQRHGERPGRQRRAVPARAGGRYGAQFPAPRVIGRQSLQQRQEPVGRRGVGRGPVHPVQGAHHGRRRRQLPLAQALGLLPIPARRLPAPLSQAVERRDDVLHDQAQVRREALEQGRDGLGKRGAPEGGLPQHRGVGAEHLRTGHRARVLAGRGGRGRDVRPVSTLASPAPARGGRGGNRWGQSEHHSGPIACMMDTCPT